MKHTFLIVGIVGSFFSPLKSSAVPTIAQFFKTHHARLYRTEKVFNTLWDKLSPTTRETHPNLHRAALEYGYEVVKSVTHLLLEQGNLSSASYKRCQKAHDDPHLWKTISFTKEICCADAYFNRATREIVLTVASMEPSQVLAHEIIHSLQFTPQPCHQFRPVVLTPLSCHLAHKYLTELWGKNCLSGYRTFHHLLKALQLLEEDKSLGELPPPIRRKAKLMVLEHEAELLSILTQSTCSIPKDVFSLYPYPSYHSMHIWWNQAQKYSFSELADVLKKHPCL